MNAARFTRWFGFALFASLSFLSTRAAVSQTKGTKPEGCVVKVSGSEIFIDIGSAAGAAAGREVEFYRKVAVKHPVTGKTVEDRFFIGKDAIVQAGSLLSLVVIKTAFTHTPVVGDPVVLLKPVIMPIEVESVEALEAVGAAEGAEAAGGGACPEAACPACDEEGLLVNAVWLKTLGRSIDDRIELWKAFLLSRPSSPYGKQIIKHLAWLEEMKKAEFHLSELSQAAPLSKVYHQGPRKVFEGMALDVTVETPDPQTVDKVILHYRRKGEKFYTAQVMERNGDFTWHFSLSPSHVKRPGVEYFIEVVGTDGKQRAAVASAGEPALTKVAGPLMKPFDKKGKSQWSTSFEYVDFYYKDAHRDYFWKLETDFLYKLRTVLYGVRMGLGFFEGQGGRLKDVESGEAGDPFLEPLSFAYLFMEMELRVVKYFYVSGRFLAGTALQGWGEPHEGDVILGGQGRIRIGEDWAYLILAGSFTRDAGVEAELSVNIEVLKKFPIAGYVLVTDLPVQEEWGVRLVGQFGWRPAEWIALSLRGGWNIRTIRHEGWSVGAVTELRW
jgi:hypothetical protein